MGGMFFRIYYHACQVGFLGFALAFAGFFTPRSWHLLEVALVIVVPMGIMGAVIGLVMVTVGLRTACPNCGSPSYWMMASYGKSGFIGIDCEQCGLLGGDPFRDLVPRQRDDL